MSACRPRETIPPFGFTTQRSRLSPLGSWPETLVLYRRRAFRRRCAWARCSGAPSIKPFEQSRLRLRRTRALWGLNGGEDQWKGGQDVCRGAELQAWKEESSWERYVC